MITGILFFGLLSGYLFFDILVGLLGSRRNIGFGWAFIISILATPIVGVIVTLLSEPLPSGYPPKYGCLGETFGCMGSTMLVIIMAAIAFALGFIFFAVV
jgi:hypothetical protein